MFSRIGPPVCGILFVLLGVCHRTDGQETGKVILPQSHEAIVQPNTTLCELVNNPQLYNGREVTIQSKYVLGFEWSAFFSEECPDRIWLEWRGLDDTSAQSLKRAYNTGPAYLTVPVYLTVQGTFASGGRFGHLGAYSYQIVAHKVLSLLRVTSETHALIDLGGLEWKTFGVSVQSLVTKSWIANMPESVQEGQQGKNSVMFRVLRDGSVPDDSVKVVSSSDTSELDEASLKAVRAAAPFDNFPENFSQPFISLCTVFHYNPRTSPTKDESPYSKALFATIGEMDKAAALIDDSMSGSRIRTDYHHMVVEKDPEITEALPEQFGEYHVEYLDTQQLTARFKKLRKEFSVLKIQPVKADSKVSVDLYWVSYKKRKLNFGLSDWGEVRLVYDCEKQTFIVSNVNLDGV